MTSGTRIGFATGEAKLRATLGTRAVRCLDWLSIVVLIPIAYIVHLQSKRVDAGWLTSYGADVLGTAWCWWWMRRIVFVRLCRPAEAAAVAVLAAGLAWEFCQRYDLSRTLLARTKGTYDPLDIAAYALTLGACYTIDKSFQRRTARSSQPTQQVQVTDTDLPSR